MKKTENIELIAFGPVPSRRLGNSLGINNIPAKKCSYSCVYCQVGRTIDFTIERDTYYQPKDLFRVVKKKVEENQARNEEPIDYLTFVADGEPTLDTNLKEHISLLGTLDIPIAIITNASLLWHKDVREDLLDLDLVSIKVDALSNQLWRRINRPHKSLSLENILIGIKDFSNDFSGILISETMLIDKIIYDDEFEKISEFLGSLKNLKTAYISIPTRPPQLKWVVPPSEETLNYAFHEFSKRLGMDRVEYLIGYEGDAFVFTGNIEADLLAITAVHPMRKGAIETLLKKACMNWQVVENLLRDEKIVKVDFEGIEYYLRKLG